MIVSLSFMFVSLSSMIFSLSSMFVSLSSMFVFLSSMINSLHLWLFLYHLWLFLYHLWLFSYHLWLFPEFPACSNLRPDEPSTQQHGLTLTTAYPGEIVRGSCETAVWFYSLALRYESLWLVIQSRYDSLSGELNMVWMFARKSMKADWNMKA